MNAQYTFINFSDRLQETSTDFLIDLSDIDLSAQRHGIQIQNFILPNNYYNINSYNNEIKLGITDGTITIPEGNYSSTEFINYFNTNNGLGINAALDSQTGMIDYASASSFEIHPTNKQKYLGPSAGDYSGTSITGNSFADFSGSNYFDVLMDGISLYSVNTKDYNRNILCRLYNKASFGQFINYQLGEVNMIKVYENSNFNTPVRFQIVDENGDLYDLKGLNWQMTMCFLDQYS